MPLHPFWGNSKALEYMVLLVNGLVPHCRFVHSQVASIELLGLLGRHCSDSAKLELVFPVLQTYFESREQRVVAVALEEMVRVLARLRTPFREKQSAVKHLLMVRKAFAKLCRAMPEDSLVVLISFAPAITEILGRLYEHLLAFEVEPPSREFTDMLLERIHTAPAEACYRFLEVLGSIRPHYLEERALDRAICSICNTHLLTSCKFSRTLPMSPETLYPFLEPGLKKSSLHVYYLL